MNGTKLRRLRDQPRGAPTLISQGCKIVGEIGGEGEFQISGEIQGDCNVDGTVTLLANGYWQGSINAVNVIVAGHVEGDITARGKVEISQTARIAGTVTAEAIAVAEGAVVEGAMKTTGPAAPLEFVEKRGD